jgi:hypothetical protein
MWPTAAYPAKMTRATLKMREIAERIIAEQPTSEGLPNSGVSPALDAYLILRPQFVSLMGTAGFHALVSRALALAKREVPCMRQVRLRTDGSLEWPEQGEGSRARAEARDVAEGGAVLLSHVLGLLATFIGEGLTLRLVDEVRPEARSDASKSKNGV